MRSTYLCKFAAACAALSFTAAACAQYIWLDEKGVRQYSDMPPGPSVPASRILKQPAGQPQQKAAASAPADTKEDTEAAAAPGKAAPTLAERNAEFLKRRTAQAEREKKAEDEAKRTAEKQVNCERARASNRAMESGQRIYTTAPSGGRHYLTGEERTKQIDENNKLLEGCAN